MVKTLNYSRCSALGLKLFRSEINIESASHKQLRYFGFLCISINRGCLSVTGTLGIHFGIHGGCKDIFVLVVHIE